MLTKRIIPCLDVKDGVVVKGVKFKNHEVVGSIIDLAIKYNDQGADEIVFYDIAASTVDGFVSLRHGLSKLQKKLIYLFAWLVALNQLKTQKLY